jgi:hypothetical protein
MKLRNPGKEPETGRLSRRLRADAISYTVSRGKLAEQSPWKNF